MKNWSIDFKKFKTSTQKRAWELAQQMNFGIDKKLNSTEIKTLWTIIAPQLSADTKRLWELWLWNKRSSLQNTDKFWMA
jgi:hypothetical protein